jgi:hypothetical protein
MPFASVASFFLHQHGNGCFRADSTSPLPRASAFAFASSPTQSLAKATGLPIRALSAGATGARLCFGSGLPFGTAEMAGEDDFGALFDQELDGRQRLLNARGVRDHHLAVFLIERHVEIDAHKDAFSGKVEVTNGLLGHGFLGVRGAIHRKFRAMRKGAIKPRAACSNQAQRSPMIAPSVPSSFIGSASTRSCTG